MKGKGIGILLVFVLLAVIVLLFYQYSVSSLGATDVGVNLTGTQYEAAYNASVQTSIVAVKFQPFILYVIGFFSVIVALVVLIKIATGAKKTY